MFGYSARFEVYRGRWRRELPFAGKLRSAGRAGAVLSVLLTAGVGALFCGTAWAQQAEPSAAAPGSAAAQGPVEVQPGAPGQPSRTLPASTRPSVTPVAHADVEFMQGMIMHHSQAVEMTALIASHTENKEIRSLGAKISSSQSDEMRFMERWLAARGEPVSMAGTAAAMAGMPDMDKAGHAMAPMPGMLTPAQMAALRKAKGAEFDRLFLTGMIQHHKGALVMVGDLFDSAGAGQDADIFDFATDADNTQRAEIRIMQNMLEEKH
jgi:uncharacterized protein (DUF305 family)